MTDRQTDRQTDFQLVDSIPSARRDRVKIEAILHLKWKLLSVFNNIAPISIKAITHSTGVEMICV